MNPEQIKQEQERVKGLLDKTAPEPWEIGSFRRYAVFSLHPDASRRPVVTVRHFEGDNEPMDGEAQANLQLCAAAPTITRAYAALLDAHLALHAQLAQAEEREALREDALKAIDAAIQCEGDVLDVYQRRVSLTTLNLAVADMKQDSLPKLKAARAALAQVGATAQESLQVQPAQAGEEPNRD